MGRAALGGWHRCKIHTNIHPDPAMPHLLLWKHACGACMKTHILPTG